MNRLIAHALIYNEQNKILVIKRSKIKRGKPNYQAEKWDIPGGTVEDGELPRNAAIREAKEETGIDVRILNIIYESSNYDAQKDKVFTTLIYSCELIGASDIVLDFEEHTTYRWVSVNEISDNLDDYVDYLFGMIKENIL